MGDVYLAEDQKLGRKVALKFLPQEFVQNADRLRRFELEARAASGLNHPNIVTIFDVGHSDGHHFIASEYIEGQTLRDRITASGPLTVAQAIDVATQVAAALSAAHAAKIVHRDIKPENIMIREDGYIKVLDFGLAKHDAPASVAGKGSVFPTKTFAQTEPGTVLGTVQYMSPEQARGLDLDSRTDLFSLGVVLYEMTAGRIPFEGATRSDVIVSILNKEPVQLSIRVPDVPPQLEWIVNKALRKDREERYQTAKEMHGDLRALQQKSDPRLGSTVHTSTATSSVPHTSVPVATSSAEYVVQGIRKHKIAAAAVLLVGLIGSFLLWRENRPERTAVATENKSVRISRLTTHGIAGIAAISGDGKLVVYSTESSGQQSLWLKQIATGSNVSIVPPAMVNYIGLTFSQDGNYIYCVRQDPGASVPALYKTPVLGGTPIKILDHVDSPVAASPDGKSLAFVRWHSDEARLMTSAIDGSSLVIQLHMPPPGFISSVAWSPDGSRLFFAGGQGDDLPKLYQTVVGSGKRSVVTEGPWGDFRGVVAGPDPNQLLVSAAHPSTNYFYQVWSIPLGEGSPMRITNDPNNYVGLSASANSTSLVTIQNDRLSDIWITPADGTTGPKQITFERYDGRSGVSWTPDGKILFADRHFDLWLMDRDATNRRLLTSDEHSNRYPFMTPDGNRIIFESWRKHSGGQTCSLWAMSADGSNPQRLIGTKCLTTATCTGSCEWIYFDRHRMGNGIWKIPLTGGEAVEVIKEPTYDPAISPDGKKLAVIDPSKFSIAIYPVTGRSVLTTFKLEDGLEPKFLRWKPDGSAMAYIATKAGISNLWLQAVDGSTATQITNFDRDHIFSFDWFKDGSLVVSRGATQNDVMLIVP